jgi:hypothetical protein
MFSGTTTAANCASRQRRGSPERWRPDASHNLSHNQGFVHGLDADGRHDQRGAGAARRTDGAEEVGPGEPPVAL